jgi:hypothetical protein
MGIVPYTSSLVDPTRHASKERLYWLRDFCKEGIKAKTFSAPAHSMSQLYKMLETYEAHRESLKSKKPQPAVGTKVGKKVRFFYPIFLRSHLSNHNFIDY